MLERTSLLYAPRRVQDTPPADPDRPAASRFSVHAAPVSLQAQDTARYALATYAEPLIASQAKMVSFNTVADPAVLFTDNPQHTGFKRYLAQEAQRLGFDFHDHGHVPIIGMGKGRERVGVITHGAVQPVNPAKWGRSPFELDRSSEPGKLLGWGTEDDKGPIATALYAMKATRCRQRCRCRSASRGCRRTRRRFPLYCSSSSTTRAWRIRNRWPPARRQFAPVAECRQLRPGHAAHGVHGTCRTRVHDGKTVAAGSANVHGCLDRAGEIAACKNRRKS